ncbi:MAG: tripartite tricarboxylate transporter TctB family protein [Pseudomonadota bacterium]
MARIAVPLGLIAFCCVAFWLTTQFDRVPPILLRGMQPEHFPQLVIVLIAVLSLAVMMLDPVVDIAAPDKMVWISMGLFAVFGLVTQIDLFLALGIFAGALAFLWGERRTWALVLVALIAPTAVFFLFDQIFEVRFPRGALTNLWYG